MNLRQIVEAGNLPKLLVQVSCTKLLSVSQWYYFDIWH